MIEIILYFFATAHCCVEYPNKCYPLRTKRHHSTIAPDQSSRKPSNTRAALKQRYSIKANKKLIAFRENLKLNYNDLGFFGLKL